MRIGGIVCNCIEYQMIESDWVKTVDGSYSVDYRYIDDIVQSSNWFEGGMCIKLKPNRRFGLVPVVIVSQLDSIKRVYRFNYNNARGIEDVTESGISRIQEAYERAKRGLQSNAGVFCG